MKVLQASHVLTDAASPAITGGAVAVEADRVRMVGDAEDVRRAFPAAHHIDLGDVLLMPGFVNAHQHGRGLSQIQLGYHDDELEPWIASRRRRGSPDTYALTKLAALEMMANGVTSTLHANYSYGSGDYESEVRGAIRAYDETGIRATVCVGYADQGSIVYPPSDSTAFLALLTPETRQYLERPSRPAYMSSVDATIDLMARLLEEYADHPRITLAYGPAGPQWVSDEAWRTLSRDAAEKNVGLHFHLLESPAQSENMRQLHPDGVLVHLETLGIFEAKASCAHFTQASAPDIAAAKRLGLIVVTNPGSNMRLFNGTPPLRGMKAAGLTVALGTDNCALTDDEDYLRELRLGGLLSRAPNGSNGEADTAALVEMATVSGAKAAFLDDVGKLQPDAKADIVAIDLKHIRGAYLDPDMNAVDAVFARGSGRDVVLTMVAGRILFQDSAFTSANLAQARMDSASSARSVRSAGQDANRAATEFRSALRAHYYGLRHKL